MKNQWMARLAALALAVVSGSAMAATTMPKDGSFDFNFCFVTDLNHIEVSDTAGLGSFTNVAAIHSNPAGGAFDLQGARCFGHYSNVEGTYTEVGYCEIKDADGDRWFMKFSGNPDGTGTWTNATGVGKYAGMVATGNYTPLGMVTAVVVGKNSRCNRNVGTFKLK